MLNRTIKMHEQAFKLLVATVNEEREVELALYEGPRQDLRHCNRVTWTLSHSVDLNQVYEQVANAAIPREIIVDEGLRGGVSLVTTGADFRRNLMTLIMQEFGRQSGRLHEPTVSVCISLPRDQIESMFRAMASAKESTVA